MKSSPRSRRSSSSPCAAERGYILIVLILFVALLAISLTALAPVITQQIKRDREEELIHRGTQYSRAIKHYMKKFNGYPPSIEALEKTNEIRYLRKRYKDPITGQDFKLLHMGEVQIAGGPGIAGANSVASLAAGAGAAGSAFGGGSATPLGGNGGFGGGLGGNTGGTFGGNSGGAFGGNTGGTFGSNSGSPFGGNSGGALGGNNGGLFGGGNSPNTPSGGQTANNADNGPDAQGNQPQGAPTGQGGFGQPLQNLSAGANQQGSGNAANGNPVIGGGPILGVASTSKDKSIRSFNKKDHYKDWLFVYDPTSDRGGLITTPYQTPQINTQSLAGAQGAGGPPGTPGTQGAPPSPFGFGNGQQNAPGGFGPSPQLPQTPQLPPEQAPQ